jgi:hypothetical protein
MGRIPAWLNAPMALVLVLAICGGSRHLVHMDKAGMSRHGVD